MGPLGNERTTELNVTSLALPPQPFTLFVTEPTDQSITTNSSVRLIGRTNPETEIRVNGVGIPVNPLLGIFSTEIALELGPNVIIVKAFARDGRELNKVIIINRNTEIPVKLKKTGAQFQRTKEEIAKRL